VTVWQGVVQALELLVSFDSEVMAIAGRSLAISLTATGIATAVCIPAACVIHFGHVPAKRWLIALIQTFYSVPTVLVGPELMVIGQAVLVSPILLGLIISALAGTDRRLKQTATSLGASHTQAAVLVMREARYGMLTAMTMGFGRAISEVGLALMVGGNIKWHTRTITTAIALETSKGMFAMGIALGLVLLLIAFSANAAVSFLRRK